MTSVVQHRVRTGDGITLAAEYYPHDGDRPVVFLLHGGGQNRHAWTTSARRLQSRGYSVVAYDTRGHGDSDWDPAGRYDVERLATDLLAVRDHFSANTPPAVVGASLGGMTALGAHLLASGASWAAVILVDVTPRLEFEGARRVVTFMAAHPDGFATLGDAAEVIAAYNPHRARPENLDGLHKVLRQRPDGRWVWRWDPAFVHSNFDFLRDGAAAGTEQFDAISHLLIDGARRVTAPLAGALRGSAGAICRDSGDAGCVERLQKSLADLNDADGLRLTRAEISMCLAGVLHEQAGQQPQLMATAIPHYHSTLQLIKRADSPLLWAAAHAGLAAAYLTMPMVEASSQLRLGVAAQSLRSALTVYTRDDHPQEWASVQLNLANSLVYTPSRHHRENLVEAVELYEAVLQMRDRTTDPLGRARVLANQGNVLAHLGVFDDAKAKLYDARFLFEELGEDESVRAVRGVLDEIARQRALSATDELERS